MKPYLTLLLVGLFAVSLGACSPEEEEKPAAKGPPVAKVSVTQIAENSLTERRKFLGEVKSGQSTELAAGGSGEVLRVLVSEGDSVTRGQLLAQLDDAIHRARLDELQATLSRSDVELQQAARDTTRLENLSGKGFFPSAEVEQISTRKDALEASRQGQQASVRRLREEIAQLRITAPFDGVIARRMVSPGQWLQTGQSAFELASQGQRELHVRVPSTILDLVPTNSVVTIHRGADSVSGEVAGVVGQLDSRTRTALLRVLPQSSPEWLREGDAVEVSLGLERSGEGVVVPADAIVYGIAGTRVFRIAENKAEPIPVEIVTEVGDKVLVFAEGLSVGQTIVTRGNERLRPGQDVQVVE